MKNREDTVLRLRNQYYQYIYRILEIDERKVLYIHHETPEILQKYMNDNSLTEDEKEICKEWENEIYGFMHIVYVYGYRAIVYVEKTNQIYDVKLLNKENAKDLKLFPFYYSFYGSLVTIQKKQYLDIGMKFDFKTDRMPLSGYEELYEHIYQLALKKTSIMSKCKFFTKRKLGQSNFSDIFFDFIGPFDPCCMEEDNLKKLLEMAYMVWNQEILEDDTFMMLKNDLTELLKERKKKYFSHVNRALVAYHIDYDYNGELELKTATAYID